MTRTFRFAALAALLTLAVFPAAADPPAEKKRNAIEWVCDTRTQARRFAREAAGISWLHLLTLKKKIDIDPQGNGLCGVTLFDYVDWREVERLVNAVGTLWRILELDITPVEENKKFYAVQPMDTRKIPSL
jgi:hypothetical protein